MGQPGVEALAGPSAVSSSWGGAHWLFNTAELPLCSVIRSSKRGDLSPSLQAVSDSESEDGGVEEGGSEVTPTQAPAQPS